MTVVYRWSDGIWNCNRCCSVFVLDGEKDAIKYTNIFEDSGSMWIICPVCGHHNYTSTQERKQRLKEVKENGN